ncbi:unnamed protein product [Medioppia subpectinata]|uniref:Nuclear receptor domain-containing protein n=1 Tax=Medioppia subpectinata TaxID=1979941 RepID=A0A7R9KKQ9_9ACAR|nr:unnamed protein product [Medioppia subpectinata]CAG2104052.1 unnamed protein product [Medioppia subpectinata]
MRNFEAMTCESCKIFFRRHGLKNQQLICASNGKCDINVMTRSLCRKCRLEKCFAVGMKKELIRSVDQNNYRKALIKENKSKHKLSDESHNCDDFSSNNSQNNSIISDTTIDENFTTDSLDNNLLDFDDIDWDVNNCHLNGFNNICAEDRHMLMKYGTKDQLLIRCLKYYNKDIKSFIIPIDRDHSIQYSLDLYKLLDFKTMMEIYYEKLEQQLYIYLLQRYLLLKYRSESDSQTKGSVISWSMRANTLAAHNNPDIRCNSTSISLQLWEEMAIVVVVVLVSCAEGFDVFSSFCRRFSSPIRRLHSFSSSLHLITDFIPTAKHLSRRHFGQYFLVSGVIMQSPKNF